MSLIDSFYRWPSMGVLPPLGMGSTMLVDDSDMPQLIDTVTLFPTHLARDKESVRHGLVHVIRELQRCTFKIHLVICVQYRADNELTSAIELATSLLECTVHSISIEAHILKSSLKVDSINLAYERAKEIQALRLFWIDDDVEIEDGGVQLLLTRTIAPDAQRLKALGLAKAAVGSSTRTARFLSFRRSILGEISHPHGCCVVVKLDSGILPIPRDCSDDGWIAASCLTGEANIPAECEILTQKRVLYNVTTDWRMQCRRVWRMFVDSYMIIARLDSARASRFVRNALFRDFFILNPPPARLWLKLLFDSSWVKKQGMQLGTFIVWFFAGVALIFAHVRRKKVSWPFWC